MKILTTKYCSVVLFGVLVCVGGRPGYATNYSDGGIHTIFGTDSNVTISNGTTVNVAPGATVTGMNNDPFAFTAITVNDNLSSLNVTGGSITGGDGSHAGGHGLLANGGNFNISGGDFAGGNSSGTTQFEPGGNGAYFANFQSLSISGGSFTGGSGYPNGMNGDGVRIDFFANPNTAFISGGTFTGAGVGGDALHVTGAGHVNISGGVFTAPLVSLEGNSITTVTNGQFQTEIQLLNSAIVNAIGGRVDFEGHDSSMATVTGGTLTSSSLFDNSVLSIHGGHIGSIDFFLDMHQNSILNVYGTGLTLQPAGFGNYLTLQGTLADGTQIPGPTFISLSDSSVVNLINVPEPSGVILAALGLLSLAPWSWRRRAALRAACSQIAELQSAASH